MARQDNDHVVTDLPTFEDALAHRFD